MKKAHQDVESIQSEEDGKVWGVNLGYDYCSEHEWGVDGLKTHLGLKDESRRCLGIQNKLIRNKDGISYGEISFWLRKGSVVSSVEKPGYSEKKAYYFESSNINQWMSADIREEGLRKGRTDLISTYDIEESEKNIWSEWDESGFRLVTLDKELCDALIDAFEATELTIGLSSKSNPFTNSGMLLIDARAFSDELKKEMEQEEIDFLNLKKKSDKFKKRFDRKLKKRGLGYHALSPRSIGKEEQVERNTRYDFIYWLNPTQQSLYESCWCSVEDLNLWLKGKGPIIKKENADGEW
jgi:hypothetical protein